MKTLAPAAAGLLLSCALSGAGAMAKTVHHTAFHKTVPAALQSRTTQSLIQGRITSLQGSLIQVKTPDYGPGLQHGRGIHSMLVISGPAYTVDLSQVRYGIASGAVMDKVDLAVGDQVIVLLDRSITSDDRLIGAKPIRAVLIEKNYAAPAAP